VALPEIISDHEKLQDCCSWTFVKLDSDFALAGIATLGFGAGSRVPALCSKDGVKNEKL
jgi:hypothetical protein